MTSLDGWSSMSVAMAAMATTVVANILHVACLRTLLISLVRCGCCVIKAMLGWLQKLSINVVTVIVNPVSEPEMVAMVLYKAWRVVWLCSAKMSLVYGDQMVSMRTTEIIPAAMASAAIKCRLYHR